MSRTWFSRRSLNTDSESIDFEVNNLANATINHKRILTAPADVPTMINENIGMVQPSTSVDLTVAGVIIPWAAISNASIDGITKISATTFQTTKKGRYDWAIQLTASQASTVVVQLFVDGVGQDSQLSTIGVEDGVSDQALTHNFYFPKNFDVDGVHLWRFTGYGTDLPTPDASTHMGLCEITVQHINFYPGSIPA